MDDVFERGERATDPRLLATTDFMALADPSWRPLWWRAERVGQPSAWWQHVPFAHWLVGAIRPRCLVELGTHAGVSYAAFCQAVALGGTETRCFAVDTWKGDKQAGEYGEDVYSDLSRFHEERYAGFSTLLRSTFDEALDKIPDGSVDLLHIDGLHTYDAVRSDYEHWRPKLSRQGVILFHDTNEHHDDFGVWRLWAELRAQYPSFEFLHGHGLGVLAVGEEVPAAVATLCKVVDRGALAAVRNLFARLGERWEYETRERMVQADLARHAGAAAQQAQAAASQFETMNAEMQRLTQAVERERTARAEFESLHDEVHRVAEASEQSRLSAERARVAAEQAAAAAHERSSAATEQRGRAERERERLAHALAHAEATRTAVASERDQLAAQLRGAEARLHDTQERVAGLDAQLRAVDEARAQAVSERDDLLTGYRALAGERDVVLSSTMWRATRPLRQLAHHVPPGARRLVRGSAKLAWWSARLSLLRRLRERKQMLTGGGPVAPVIPAPVPDTAPVLAREMVTAPPVPAVVSVEAVAAPPLVDIVTAPAARRVVWVSGEVTTPGHTYRVLRPAAAAAAIGLDASVIPLTEVRQRLPEIERTDVLILWRLAWDEAVGEAIAAAKRGGARVLFDVDDLMFDPAHARAGIIDAIRSSQLDEAQVGDYFARVQAVMHQADLCLASTEEIAVHMRELGRPAVVLPNGFDTPTWEAARLAARLAARHRAGSADDGVVRIGYAGGTATHQRDFALCAEALASVLRAFPQVRLVLFRKPDGTMLVNLDEFPALRDMPDRIEWRNSVALAEMPAELARFDINLAPLEVGNPFCEAKSELKFFDAALANVPTVASPTGPFRRAIRNGETGFLAETTAEWTELLTRLVRDPPLRHRVAAQAALSVLWPFGPERRAQELGTILDLQAGGRVAAEAFATPGAPSHPDRADRRRRGARNGRRGDRRRAARGRIFLGSAVDGVRQRGDPALQLCPYRAGNAGLGVRPGRRRSGSRGGQRLFERRLARGGSGVGADPCAPVQSCRGGTPRRQPGARPQPQHRVRAGGHRMGDGAGRRQPAAAVLRVALPERRAGNRRGVRLPADPPLRRRRGDDGGARLGPVVPGQRQLRRRDGAGLARRLGRRRRLRRASHGLGGFRPVVQLRRTRAAGRPRAGRSAGGVSGARDVDDPHHHAPAREGPLDDAAFAAAPPLAQPTRKLDAGAGGGMRRRPTERTA